VFEQAPKNRAATPWLDLIYGLAFAILLGSALWALLDHLRIVDLALSTPYPLVYSESLSIDRALQIPDLHRLYPASFGASPLRISSQPPLFPALLAPLVQGVAPSDAFAAARSLSIAAFLIAGLASAGTVFGLTRSVGGAIAAASLLWLFPQLQLASILAAPDAVALAFGTLGLCSVALLGARTDRVGNFAVAASGIFFTLCIAAQPPFVVAPLAAAAAWLVHRNRRIAALSMLAGMAIACTAFTLALQAVTDGGFVRHLLDFGLPDWSKTNAVGFLVNQTLRSGLLMIPCLMFFITEPLGARYAPARPAFVLMATALVMTVLASRVGSLWPVTLPLSAATCIVFGVVVGWLRNVRWVAALAVVFAMLQIDTLKDWRADDFLPDLNRRFRAARDVAALDEKFRAAGGPILTDEYIGLLSLEGSAPVIYPLEFNMLHQRGAWSVDELVAAIERREFALVAWYEPIDRNDRYIMTRWPEEVRKAVYRTYYDGGYLADAVIYLPAKP
jgi:hypothetical protein